MENKLSRTGFAVLILDIIIILISLLLSWAVRSKFPYFYFKLSSIIIVFPYVALSRIIINLFFENYTLSYLNFQINDVINIFKHNIIPTVLFALIRIFSPFEVTRMPFGIILSEYMITSIGFILLRAAVYNINIERNTQKIEDNAREVILIMGVENLQDNLDVTFLSKKYNITIVGILTQSIIDIDLDYSGIRIIGEIEDLERILTQYPDLDFLVMGNRDLASGELNAVIEQCKKKNITLYALKDLELVRIKPYQLINRLPPKLLLLPDDILNEFSNKKLIIWGYESPLAEYLIELLNNIPNVVYRKISLISSPDKQKATSGGEEIMIDLRLMINASRRNSENSLADKINEILSDYEKQYKNIKIKLLAIPVSKSMEWIKAADYANIDCILLFINGIVYPETEVDTLHKNQHEYWDLPEYAASYIVKTLIESKNGRGFYYCRSIDAADRKKVTRIVDQLKYPYRNSYEDHSDSEQQGDFFEENYELAPAGYYGLYEFRTGKKY